MGNCKTKNPSILFEDEPSFSVKILAFYKKVKELVRRKKALDEKMIAKSANSLQSKPDDDDVVEQEMAKLLQDFGSVCEEAKKIPGFKLNFEPIDSNDSSNFSQHCEQNFQRVKGKQEEKIRQAHLTYDDKTQNIFSNYFIASLYCCLVIGFVLLYKVAAAHYSEKCQRDNKIKEAEKTIKIAEKELNAVCSSQSELFKLNSSLKDIQQKRPQKNIAVY